MADEVSQNDEAVADSTEPRVRIVDCGPFGPSPYPEDGIPLLERWANQDPPSNHNKQKSDDL